MTGLIVAAVGASILLGDSVADLRFERGVAVAPTLSPLHALAFLESTFGPPTRLLAATRSQPDHAATVRAEVLDLVTQVFTGNAMRQQFLMTRAIKRGSEASR